MLGVVGQQCCVRLHGALESNGLYCYFQLYNVVVDTEVTGKKLISNGKLKRRYTFIPLNKIASRTLSGDVVKRAEGLVSCPLFVT